MKIEFLNKHLKDLYEKGKSRKYKLDIQVIRKFVQRVGELEAAVAISDLWKTPSMNFEKLKGLDTYSVRLNRQYRMEMVIDWEDDKKIVGIIGLTDISNHYGD